MTDDASIDFFISYTLPDRAWAEWIAWQLESEGYATAIQAWDFRPGGNFAVAMQDASVNAQRTVAVISPAFFASPHTTAEWAAAFRLDPDGRLGKFVPVRVRECDPPGLHGAVVYIDLVGLDEPAARSELLDGLRPGRRKPEKPPGFPGGAPAVAERTPDYPGGAPPIWNIPSASVSFAGRERALAGLEERLTGAGRAAVTQAHAVYGLGGIGKTQLVARYAELHRDEYDIGWWIRAEQEATRVADLAALGQQLGLPGAEERDMPALAAATLGWLGRSSRWVLVIDNVAGLDAAAALMPDGAAGHVLITSRAHADWGQIGAEPLALEVWERDESIDFLLDRTQERESEAAGEIAELLGDLPLALAQAAAYTNKQGITLAGYRERLLDDTRGLLAKGELHDYTNTVASTWALAFEQIRGNEAAARILRICAYLAPERIPRELLDHAVLGAAESGGPGGTPGAADDAIELLLDYSLLTPVAGEMLDMHRLVQQVIRDQQTQSEQEGAIRIALLALAARFPDEPREPDTWLAATRLLTHAVAVTERARMDPQVGSLVGSLLDRASEYLWARGEFEQARELSQQACDALERSVGGDAPMVARALRKLGVVQQSQGDLAAARGTQERALEIEEALDAPYHHEIAATLVNLGIVLEQQGELDAARRTLERALAIQKATHAPNDREVAATLVNLGIVQRLQGDLAAARGTQERALEIEEAVYGRDHHEVATVLVNLGIVQERQSDLAAARGTQERALAILEAAYGPDHHDVAHALGNLGIVRERQGDLDGARSMLERALEIQEGVYGPDHHEVAATLVNLGIVLAQQDDPDGARSMLERALEIQEAAYRPDHYEVATTLVNIGIVLQSQGDLKAARSTFERALSIFQRSLRPAHDSIVMVSDLLSSLT